MSNEHEFSHISIVDDFYKYLVELADNKKQVQCLDPEMKFCQECEYGGCVYQDDVETSSDLYECCFYTACMYGFDKVEEQHGKQKQF